MSWVIVKSDVPTTLWSSAARRMPIMRPAITRPMCGAFRSPALALAPAIARGGEEGAGTGAKGAADDRAERGSTTVNVVVFRSGGTLAATSRRYKSRRYG